VTGDKFPEVLSKSVHFVPDCLLLKGLTVTQIIKRRFGAEWLLLGLRNKGLQSCWFLGIVMRYAHSVGS